MDPARIADALARTDLRAWSLHATTTRRAALGIKDGHAGNPHAPFALSDSAALHYRLVWRDGRISRGTWERGEVARGLGAALDQARVAAYDDPDATRVLGPASFPEVDLHDAAVADAARGDVTELAERLALLRELVRTRAFRTWSGSFSASTGTSRVVSSAGLDAMSSGTAASWHVTWNGELGDGYGARKFEERDQFRARLERLALLAEALGRDAAPAHGPCDTVLLHPRVVEAYVVETLLANLDGSAVAHGQSHFDRDAFGSGRPVLREDIDLGVDPLLPFRLGAYSFTGEGVSATRTSFVEHGRLLRPVLDLKYAKRLGLEPTAQPGAMDVIGFRGADAVDLDCALDRSEGGALVLSVLGIHTQDAVSGDFSLSAPQALRIGAGGFEGRLRATISGNLFDILRQEALTFVAFDGETTPGLLIRCRLDPT